MLDVEPVSLSRPPVSVRSLVRRGVAGMAVIVAVLYYLIGTGMLDVADGTEDMTAFGLMAGTAYLAAAAVAAVFDRRSLWAAGALTQAFIIWTYFELAPERDPSFEAWGIAIRVLQVVILGALVYLAVRRPEREAVTGREPTEAPVQPQNL